MNKNRLCALTVTVIMLLSLFAFSASADASWADFLNYDGVAEPMPKGNLLTNSSFDDESCLTSWAVNGQTLEHYSTPTGGYVRMSNIPNPSYGFEFSNKNSPNKISAGHYKFTGYFRMAYEGEVTVLRLAIHDKNNPRYSGTNFKVNVYPTSDEWLKVECYLTLDSDFLSIVVMGGTQLEYIQSYCVDNFSLEKVDSIPSDYVHRTSFGTPVTKAQVLASNNGSAESYSKWDPELEKQYEVQGIVYNRDIDFLSSCKTIGTSISKQMLEDYVYGFKDTHITDFMINIFCQIIAYPSAVGTDFVDQYYYNKDNGYEITGNQQMAYIMFERKNLDYIKVFCDTFPEIGINPWLSFRMNDAHGVQTPSDVKIWDFFTQNPQYRRVQHGSVVNSYNNNLFDYSYEGVRDYMLALFNESLDRYDCYGIELDFQREIWLWHNGGEYAGLDILNDFMRDLDRLVKVYEEKYGHEIKVAVRVASDIQTNYDLGCDIITWASEGLIDLVNPTARWATTDYDIPVRAWTAVMHPYGVEVAPGIEASRRAYASGNAESTHTLDTMCAASASWFSQGADKVYVYNIFAGLTSTIKEEDRISTDKSNLSISGGTPKGHFNMLTTIGSYEKVINRQRKLMVSFNDITPIWKSSNEILPLTCSPGKTCAMRIPMGDVPEGATVTLRFAANTLNLQNLPTVYINGQKATYLGSVYEANSFTTNKFMTYEIPASAHDDMFIVVEITPQKYLSIGYADVVITPAGME